MPSGTFLGYRDAYGREMHCSYAECFTCEKCIDGCISPIPKLDTAPPPAGAETAEQWSARWQKAKEEMANLPAEADAEQIRDTLRTHIFVNRRHEVAGLDDAAQAVLALYALQPQEKPTGDQT